MVAIRRPARAALVGAGVFALLATASPAIAESTDLSEVPAYSTQLDRPRATDEAFVSAAQECSDEPRDLPINEFTDHRELGIELDRIERISDGKVDVQQIGMSNRGREIWSARAGTGPGGTDHQRDPRQREDRYRRHTRPVGLAGHQ